MLFLGGSMEAPMGINGSAGYVMQLSVKMLLCGGVCVIRKKKIANVEAEKSYTIGRSDIRTNY